MEDLDNSTIDEVDNSTIDEVDKSNSDEVDNSTIDEVDNSTIDEVDNSTIDEVDNSTSDEVDKFDQLVKKNKDSGKDWYRGLDGNWWWGMSEDEARNKIMSGETSGKNHNRRRIAVASIVRNEEHNGHLKKFFDCCQKLERYYDIVYIFIEGDSEDNTYKELKRWLSPRNDYILKKVDRKKPRFPKDKSSNRTKYFAELRNVLIGYALSIPDISEVLMIDANYGWKGDLVSLLRGTNADIAAPLVVMNKNHNGKHIFYDTWAFRKNGSQFSHYYPYIGYSKLDKPVSVDSVGGGYLIKRKVLEANVKYNGDRDCEHVGFCRKARKKGFSIKVNPRAYIVKGGLRR